MSVSNGPSIVTSGLVLSLDAADKNSYPGSGTTWTDLSGNANNGTLTNGPTFSSANQGTIVFDGVDDYTSCGNASNLQITVGTISAWVKTSSPGSSYRGIIVKQNAWGLFVKDSILIAYDWGNFADRTTGINIADGTWKNVAMTFTETIGTPSNNVTIYLNGSAVQIATVKNFNQSVPVELAAGGGGGQNLNGTISGAQIYNRALTASEIAQNYNATKSRFNL